VVADETEGPAGFVDIKAALRELPAFFVLDCAAVAHGSEPLPELGQRLPAAIRHDRWCPHHQERAHER